MNYIAITIDYETWHPIPDGGTIDWEKDIFTPTSNFLQICEQEQVKLTLMAEMGEYFWLHRNIPEIANKMEQQWVDAVRAGHDVQLHLHPNWLPELGAQHQDNQWLWDWSKKKAHDCPGDLADLIKKCKLALESILKRETPEYQVTSFRAGAYQAQPFRRLHDALVLNNIYCDSSVYAGGVSTERGYNYSLAYSNHQPYFANAYDPQLKAPPSEQGVIEIPIFTFKPGQRWFLDGSEGGKIADHLYDYLNYERHKFSSNKSFRRPNILKTAIASIYFSLKPFHRWVNNFTPKFIANSITSYGPEQLVQNGYFVLIGHTKGEHDFDAIAKNLHRLKLDNSISLTTLSELVKIAQQELPTSVRKNGYEEVNYQVNREYQAIMSDLRNEAQSYYLQDMIPLDRNSVLDIGCGTGYWSHRISILYPWMHVTGVDFGADFIAKAKTNFNSPRLSFYQEDFAALSFQDNTFDCVYADNTLEHAYDVDKTLHEVFRVLRIGGLLVAAIPSDARAPSKICDNHVWKTVPHEVLMRLHNAGFVNVVIDEVDTYRKLGMPPYPPSDNNMMYITAWKRPTPANMMNRAVEAMDWVYKKLNPEQPQASTNPVKILAGGYAWCLGYTIVLGNLLQNEGFNIKWVTMLAKDHPRGRGAEKIDSHEVLLLKMENNEVILDPMTNTCISVSLSEVLKNPSFAMDKENPDSRYRARNYCWYDTNFWYSRVFKYCVRSKINGVFVIWKKNKFFHKR